MLDLKKNWKGVIDSLHKGVVVIDTGGIIRHVNPALENLTGYGADELIGHSCTVLVCSNCEPWYNQEDFRCMLFSSGLAMKPFPCWINSKSGHPLNVFKQAAIFHNEEGVVLGAVETIWDIEEFNGSASGNCCC